MAKTLIYQLYPLAWSSIREMTAFLPRVKALGATHVWLSPIYPSPRYDGGYDVADYYNVDYRLGSLTDFDEFVRTAHALGLKVIMDLVLNHTSTEHTWFHSHPDYYIWNKTDKPGWVNLFDGGSAWQYHALRDKYYCHLFHQKQADLNWFPGGKLNMVLVEEFTAIIKFWIYAHGVDGFRLDAIQALNKKLNADSVSFTDLLIGERATTVISRLSHQQGIRNPFFMAEVFDPQGSIVDYYAEHTDIEYITNVGLKDEKDMEALHGRLEKHIKNPRFILELESHDSPRFTSRSGLPANQILADMFGTDVKAICLYQGQELGLDNPTPLELPLSKMVEIDAMTAMQLERGADPQSLRNTSRANARVPLPLDLYAKQELDPHSTLSRVKQYIQFWLND